MMTTIETVEAKFSRISNLLGVGSKEQRIEACRILLKDKLESDWYTRFPDSVGSRAVDALLRSGNVSGWIGDQIEKQVVHAGWSILKLRGVQACCQYTGRSDGKRHDLDSRQFLLGLQCLDGIADQAITALEAAIAREEESYA